MSRFQRSIALARASWGVLRSDRSLALFPVISFFANLLVVGAIALLLWATVGTTTNAAGNTEYTPSAVTIVVGIVGYVAAAYVQTYFLAGLVASADEVLHGRPTTVGEGMKVASSRAGRLLPWAIVSATVSWIIQSLEQRAGILGRIVLGLLGAAWSVLTFLTVPIIVFEDVGPVNALKRSGSLLKRTWGENIFAQIGLGFVMVLPVLVALGLGALGIASGTAIVAVPLVAVAVLIVVVASIVVSSLSGIYRTALYRYAVDGQVPTPFAGADLEHAFAPRKQRGMF